MTDPLEFLPQPEPLLEHSATEQIARQESDLPPEITVTVDLPVDILTALDRQGHRSTQTQRQVILDVLRSALGLEQTPSPQHQTEETALSETVQTATDDSIADASISLVTEIERLKLRLRQLEALIPRMEDLAGKSIAF